MKADNKYMQLAIDEALDGIRAGHGGPFGSVIVKDGKVVATAHNEVVLRNDPTCHGEINAIRKAGAALGSFNLEGCELYTTGEPCPMCLFACLWANISKIYYGCTIADNALIGFRDEHFDQLLSADCRSGLNGLLVQIDRPACLELFEEYRRTEHKGY